MAGAPAEGWFVGRRAAGGDGGVVPVVDGTVRDAAAGSFGAWSFDP